MKLGGGTIPPAIFPTSRSPEQTHFLFMPMTLGSGRLLPGGGVGKFGGGFSKKLQPVDRGRQKLGTIHLIMTLRGRKIRRGVTFSRDHKKAGIYFRVLP